MADVAIPSSVSAWMRALDWGMHHLQWHLVRIWDLLDPGSIQWATTQGWSRYAVQEGESGNGLEFLAMHRVMIQQLLAAFPQHAKLFDGWATPPTDPKDLTDPLPGNATTPFDADMVDAITQLHGDLTVFASDDEFGAFVETRLRPVPGDPWNQSSDPRTGIHNYTHARFEDSTSSLNMGDPLVNIENERFWRLHGWIDHRWTAFRTANQLADTEPQYVAALAAAEAHMPSVHVPHHPPPVAEIFGTGQPTDAPAPVQVPSDVHANILRVLSQRSQRTLRRS